MFLMGCKTNMLLFFSFTIVLVHASNDSLSLDAVFRDFASKALTKKPVTGTLLNVSLPANFSGVKVSVVRLRSATFWSKGANFSSFYIPPKVLPFPFVKRFAIVYQDLGKLSDQFYDLPGYSLAAPVIGFTAYDATNLSILGNETKLKVVAKPFLVHFPEISPKHGNFSGLKCVKFGEGGLYQLRDISDGNNCVGESNGHFSVAFPSVKVERKGGIKLSSGAKKKLIVGFSCSVGLILVGIILATSYKLLRRNKARKMVNESEKGESFESTWVGRSRMPRASMVRTQPVLENDDTL